MSGLAYLLFRVVVDARDMLTLVALSLFFAVGMDPGVRIVQSWGLRRPLAVTVVFLSLAAVGDRFRVRRRPAAGRPDHELLAPPARLHQPARRATASIHRLDARMHVLDNLRKYVESGDLAKTLAGRAVTAGTVLATTVFDGLTVLILTLYFMAYLDEIVDFGHRLVPRSRRDRAQEVSTKITRQLGEYVAGNLLVALIAGRRDLGLAGDHRRARHRWRWPSSSPCSTSSRWSGPRSPRRSWSTIVSIDSVPAGIATIVFFVLYQLGENYVLVPRLFRTRVDDQPGRHDHRRAGRRHPARRGRLPDRDPAGRGDRPDPA